MAQSQLTATAAILGAIILSRRNKHYKAVAEKEELDENHDGIPDVFEGKGD